MISGTYPCKSAKLAAAFAPLGAPVRVEYVEDHHLNSTWLRYHISLDAPPMPGRAVGWVLPLLQNYKRGELEKVDPCNPLLDGLRGIHNVSALREWQKTGESQAIFADESAGDARTMYRAGSVPVLKPGPGQCLITSDVRMVAALGVLGCGVVGRDGDKWTVHCGAFDLVYPPGQPAFDPGCFGSKEYSATINRVEANGHIFAVKGPETIRAFRDGTLATRAPEHPLHYAYHAARVYLDLLARTEQSGRLIAIKKPGSGIVGALVREDITGKGMDRVGKFFGE